MFLHDDDAHSTYVYFSKLFCCLVLHDLQLPSQFSVTGFPDMWQCSLCWRMTDSPLLLCFYNEKWTHSGTQLIDLDSLNVSIHMWGAWWNFHYHQWRFGGCCQRVCKTAGPSMLCGSSLSGIHEIVHVNKQSHKIVERTKATPNGLWSLIESQCFSFPITTASLPFFHT